MKRSFIKIDRERLTHARRSCVEPAPFSRAPRMGVGKELRGEPSLSGLMKRSFIVPGVPEPHGTFVP